ncbi:MAG: pyruvate:ferredoxin (flavodoxin) oxidoreductase [Ruminococcus sp.]
MKRKQTTMEGNQAAAHAAYAFTETAAIYPITPSSGMAEYMDEWSAAGRKNIFGQTVKVSEMQSEAGAAGAVHGSLAAGALTSTFTASQGLLLMLPNIYKIAGELLPGVFHVAARTIATHALSIFGDHSDVYACRQTGAAMLCSCSVQEIMDLAPVAHIAALKGSLPFIHFFDGFRTSHEMQKISVWDYEDLKKFMDKDALNSFRRKSLSPYHNKIMGSAQNPDIYFQNREASNIYYEKLPETVRSIMRQINSEIGTDYDLFNYYGSPDAEHIIVAMGSVCETVEETIKYHGEKGRFGLIKVRLYRPFSIENFLEKIPETVKQITVLDRTKEPGSAGEPLYLDVVSAIHISKFRNTDVFSGRYGLSSKDVTPSQIEAVLNNHTKKRFTVGINDDVTGLSLPIKNYIQPLSHDIIQCKFWGLGGDGTVSANKSSVKIIGDNTDMQVQAYFEYDSKKSRGLTISHLRFGNSHIHAPYLISKSDFTACHNPVYMHKFRIAEEVRDGGIFLLNCGYKEDELSDFLPGQVKRHIAEHNIRFYIIDAFAIGKETGLNSKISTILQAAFFKVTGIMPEEKVKSLMKSAAEKAYGKKGRKVVKMNYDAIDLGMSRVLEVNVPESWKDLENTPLNEKLIDDSPEILRYVQNIQKPILIQTGSELPVSAFLPYADGGFPMGTTAHERRNVAVDVPVWIPENCIECCLCSYVCPHAVIRPAIMTDKEFDDAPKNMNSLPFIGIKSDESYRFSVTISETDCTGCGSCAGVCPGKKGEKALEMVPVYQKEEHQEYFDYGKSLPEKKEIKEMFKSNTIKGSQFRRPLLEFSGACAGCGETPYPKLATQLFGERMYIANATGCSSIWANSSPSAAYCQTADGKGPAWSNSLFEDGAEFGFGMAMAHDAVRNRLKACAEKLLEDSVVSSECKDAAKHWLKTYDNGDENQSASDVFINTLNEYAESDNTAETAEIIENSEYLSKKSFWVFGGDGFAYDIGFGGLDHVLASGIDINILVFDTEVYSNTGGQSSKATSAGAEARFASGGKKTAKKNLAAMMMTYQNAYVAQIAMGADYNQTLKAMKEAEKYNGPSLIIAYSPCISHGIKSGLGSSQHEQAKAVKSGYWQLFRFNPELLSEGKNPLIIDSKKPSHQFEEFLQGELRFSSLIKNNPKNAEKLFEKAKTDSEQRNKWLERMHELYN